MAETPDGKGSSGGSEEELRSRLAVVERNEKVLRFTMYLFVLTIAALAALLAQLLRPRPEPPVAGPPIRRLMVPEGGILVAEGLVIRDRKGNGRITMMVDEKEDTAKLRLLDAAGNVRMTLRSSADRGSVALFDAKGKARAIVATDASGQAGFLVLDEAERPKAAFGTVISKDPSLTILDPNGFPQVRLPAPK